MPSAKASDGVTLHYEETGSGLPIIFVHEFAGDHRSWEPQLRHFGRRYRCIAYNARGYPPSAVPEDVSFYSQARAADDIRDVLKHLGIDRAHVVGLSMGGFATLHFGLTYPYMAVSLTVAGCGYGAEPGKRQQFQQEAEAAAARFRSDGSQKVAEGYALGAARVQFQNKDPRGWDEFRRQLGEHSATGSALTLLGVQRDRPSLYDLKDKLAKLVVPTLIVNGDEDEPCLDPGLMLKRTIPSSALVVLPRTGHTFNIEEPDLFNRVLGDFLAQVDAGRWTLRDPRSVSASILGSR
ncbi:MAG: alpha/beta hydrolase [Alphaproteobacteria bacterium]|nr:alpha/beta hydrolase [Alphaproteobacteria bacterium]